MRPRWPAFAGIVLVTHLALAPASAQPTNEELTVSPYFLVFGGSDMPARIDHRVRLAALAEQAGDLPRAARHLALLCQDRDAVSGLRTLAWPECERARTLARDHDIVDVKAQLQSSLAIVRLWSLNFTGAIAAGREAIATGAAIAPDAPEAVVVALAHHITGAALEGLGRFDEAQREQTLARDQCRAIGHAPCAALADAYLCRLHTGLGDFGSARTACDAARAEAAVHNDPFFLLNVEWMVGTLEAFLNRPQQSLTALQKAWTHAQIRGAEGMRPVIAQLIVDALVRLGRLDEAETWQRGLDEGLAGKRIPFSFGPQIAMRRGQIAAARGRLEDAEAAFTIGSRSLIHEMAIRGHLAVARISSVRGNFDTARQSLERAIARIEASRTNLTGSALRASYLTLHANAYRALAGLRFDTEGASAAPAVLEIIEAGRARALRDALASAQVAGEAAPPLKAAELQALLGANEVLVEYVSTESSLAAITVTRDRVTVTKLPGAGTVEDLARRVDFFHSLVQEADEAALDRPAARFYEDLLAPALADVSPQVKTLIISPDGPLHRLPFDAIGTPRLIDRWDIVMVPSAAVLAPRQHADRSHAALIVAASAGVSGLGPLAAAPEEADAVRSRIGGSIAELAGTGATRDRLLAQGLDQFAVLHFASHAVVDEERPLRSALIFAGPDGRWTAEDIYHQKLRADLVVLSACSTAAGAQTPGEGVMSLSRAFLHAGAKATIATLWDVPDAPGPVFADVLYRRLAAGEPLGAAAAEARRELRRRGAPPRAWAAYIVTGSPGTRVEIAAAANRRLLAAAISGGFAVLLLIAALVMRRSATESLRVRRIALATASVGLAAVAIGVQGWPEPGRRDLSENPAVSRGHETGAVTVTIANNRVSWNATPGADEHRIEVFDVLGTPAATTTVTTTAFDLPTTAAAGWIRVEARRAGQPLSRSALIPIAK